MGKIKFASYHHHSFKNQKHSATPFMFIVINFDLNTLKYVLGNYESCFEKRSPKIRNSIFSIFEMKIYTDHKPLENHSTHSKPFQISDRFATGRAAMNECVAWNPCPHFFAVSIVPRGVFYK